jgi:polyisoprenoid-binding protein YceI
MMKRSVCLGLALALAIPGSARAERWEITAGAEDVQVTFHSNAPMESFDGRTRQVRGHVQLDPADVSGALDLEVSVDMATLDTGISLRNRHMRENHLHTDRYPVATFGNATVVDGEGSLEVGEDRTVTLEGTLDLHGEARTMRVPVTFTRGEDGSLRVRSTFDVVLSDHGIPRPQFLMMKLGETQKVTVDLVAGPVADATAP